MDMEGRKTTARRTSRTATTRPAPVSAAKEPAKPKVARPKARPRTSAAAVPLIEERRRMVEMAAYFRAERRGFEPGLELEDWFSAEAEIEAQLAPVPGKKPVRRPRKSHAT
ncbi:MAG: DUF2934 domain-containing protein [Gammaproteobacteria bacterium]|nr:DUF2934 domain-containing protein [Gammaproteobacteria bacterium]